MGESYKPRVTRTGPLVGVPPRYAGEPPFAQITEKVAALRPQLDRWMRGQDWGWPGEVFHGELGLGKTSAAIELAKIVNREKGWLCRYEKLWRILARMKAVNLREEGELGEVELVEEFCAPALLVVDEAGSNTGTASDHRIIYQVLDARYERLLPTIITTNYDIEGPGLDGFLACFGSRTADRFTGHIVRFEGRNLREGL